MGGGGEVVAEVCVGGDENSGEKKNLPWMEIGKRSWELDGNKEGATKRGCFIFFFLWLGEEKKYQNSDSIPAQINVCSIPASRGRLGQADLKGQGEERRGWGEETEKTAQ